MSEDTTTTSELADVRSEQTGMAGQLDAISGLIYGKPEKEKRDDESENTTSEETETEAKAETSEEVTTEASTEEVEDTTWSKALGVDDHNIVLDDEGNFKGVNVKIDGQVGQVSLKDLIAGYQFSASTTNKSKALAEERKTFDSTVQQVADNYSSRLASADKLVSYLEQQILAPYQGVDWEKLRYENPGEYAAAVQDYQRQAANLEQIKNAVGDARQGVSQEQQQQMNDQQAGYIKAQAASALEKNPTWSEPEVFKKALTAMETFVGDAYGFTREEFHTVQDARLLELVKDAMAYRSGQTQMKEKLDKKIPTFIKGGSNSPKPLTQLQKLTKKAQSTTGYQKKGAELDAVAELLQGYGGH